VLASPLKKKLKLSRSLDSSGKKKRKRRRWQGYYRIEKKSTKAGQGSNLARDSGGVERRKRSKGVGGALRGKRSDKKRVKESFPDQVRSMRGGVTGAQTRIFRRWKDMKK